MPQPSLKCYIGYDSSEAEAYRVAADTLRRTSGLEAEALDSVALRERGLLYRPVDTRGDKRYDLISNAPASTDFAISRFLVPLLCQGGWALFTDCDVVYLRDVHDLLAVADERYAVQVVKHNYTPSSDTKMNDEVQLRYARKNWSSVILVNASHRANRRLSLHDVNTRTGLWLHTFSWLHDSEIGELPAEWNCLVNEVPLPAKPALLHFTRGGPWIHGWQPAEHDELWLKARSE